MKITTNPTLALAAVGTAALAIGLASCTPSKREEAKAEAEVAGEHVSDAASRASEIIESGALRAGEKIDNASNELYEKLDENKIELAEQESAQKQAQAANEQPAAPAPKPAP